jgi:hypothetical protein
MKLPNGDRAIVDRSKLVDYCLSPTHLRGRHKARIFARVLGLLQHNADLLHQALLRAAVLEEATATQRDVYGQRYVLDFSMRGPLGSGVIRSAWIVLTGEDRPRLTSCYVLRGT